MMTAKEAVEYIHSVSWKGSVPGLSRTTELLQRMGDPHKDLRFIHIVGTNGKGSTAAMLSSVLRASGYHTGLYTSPYIFRFHERMQTDGCPISDAELAEITEYVKPHAEAMADTPTEFELVTAIAMEYFRRQKADIVVLEAGMGGALDSTNVIAAPEAAVICNIGLDHTEYLGHTLAAIAETKAGILKPGTRCILYPAEVSVEQTVRQICKEKNIPLHSPEFSSILPIRAGLDGQEFSFGHRKNLHIPLLGRHQLCNAAVALTVLDVLKENGWNIPENAIADGLSRTDWPGRFQLLSREPIFVVDGGHNPQCMEALVKNIEDYLAGRTLYILTGVMADKQTDAMYPPLIPYAEKFFTVTPNNPRAMDCHALARYLTGLGAEAEACGTAAQGVAACLTEARARGAAVLACGSLYMVGEITEAVNALL